MRISITDEIQFLVGTNPLFPGLSCCNSVWIDDEVQGLFDTCAGSELLAMRDEGKLSKIDRIVHTHVHPDHTNYDSLFPEAEIWVPEREAEVMESWDAYFRFSGFDVFGTEAAKQMAARVGYDTRPVHRRIQDGEWISFGKTKWQAIWAPGHSIGHTLFFEPNESVLVAADIDLTRFGPWYGNPGSNIDEWVETIKKVIQLRPKIFLSCHCPEVVTENLEERLQAYLAVIQQRDELLLERIGSGMALEDLLESAPFFRRHPKPEQVSKLFERNMVLKHLERLEKAGRICERDNRWKGYA